MTMYLENKNIKISERKYYDVVQYSKRGRVVIILKYTLKYISNMHRRLGNRCPAMVRSAESIFHRRFLNENTGILFVCIEKQLKNLYVKKQQRMANLHHIY